MTAGPTQPFEGEGLGGTCGGSLWNSSLVKSDPKPWPATGLQAILHKLCCFYIAAFQVLSEEVCGEENDTL